MQVFTAVKADVPSNAGFLPHLYAIISPLYDGYHLSIFFLLIVSNTIK